MWLEVRYKPTTLFSMKMSSATNSAAKSLPCPSPYAVKMALLNAIITYESVETAKKCFSLIRDLEFRFALPEKWVVNNCLVRIMKLKRHDISKEEKEKLKQSGFSDEDISLLIRESESNDPFQEVVAFREYIFYLDAFKIATNLSESKKELGISLLTTWFSRINYFGKKGCFFQYEGFQILSELTDVYSNILDSSNITSGIMYPLDDVSSNAEFKNMDNYDYSTKDAKRIQQIHIFPFRQVSANKNYTFYSRIK